MNPTDLAKFDPVVLGGGPAAASGAATAGLLGKKVTRYADIPRGDIIGDNAVADVVDNFQKTG